MQKDCGRCANCENGRRLDEQFDPDLANFAAVFLRRSYQPIAPRLRWPPNACQSMVSVAKMQTQLLAEEERALCLWSDEGWGQLVRTGKYVTSRFDDALVKACAALVESWNPQPAPTWITCVPSRLHPNLMPDFANSRCPCVEYSIRQLHNQDAGHCAQKKMQNSFSQANNLDAAFAVDAESIIDQPCLLLDDMIDSRWTMTVLAAVPSGAGNVYPLALALNSPRMD